MSLTFSTKKDRWRACSRQASAERYDFWRWGCREKVCSQRCAVLLEMPVAAAKERAVHCVLPSAGLLCNALLITSATLHPHRCGAAPA